MNKTLTSMITALLVFLSGPALTETASDETAVPQTRSNWLLRWHPPQHQLRQ